MEERTSIPASQTTPTSVKGKDTNDRKTKKKTFNEADAQRLIDIIASVPKRRQTYSKSELIKRVRMAIYAGVQEGRPIDEIFMAVAPLIGISRKNFDAALGDDILKAITAIEGKRAIDTSATEIQDMNVKPSATPASARPATVPATRPASASSSPTTPMATS